MQSVDFILCGDYILTMNDYMDVITDGAIAVDGDRIVDLDKKTEILRKYTSKRTVEGRNRVLLPGLINTHTHAAMVYFRGLADDLPLKEWLEGHIWPAENHWLGPEFISDATELACLEMLKAGITTYNDMYFFGSSAALSAKKIGMRAVLGAGILDFPSASAKNAEEYLLNAENFSKEWKGDELIIPSIAPHAVYTCSSETFKKAKRLAERLGLYLHIHLSETEWEVKDSLSRFGKRPVEYLYDIGFLDSNVLAAHCVWLSDNEINIISEMKVGVSHCIESNLKLASGIAPVVKLINSNVKVSFGTDSAASNNDLNILGEMSTASKVHKAINNDPTVLDSKTVVKMATRWAAEVLGISDKIGTIEKGKIADVISINLKSPHLVPLYDIYSHIVYAAQPSDIEMVMVNGKMVVNNGRLLTADEDEILSKALRWGERIMVYNRGR